METVHAVMEAEGGFFTASVSIPPGYQRRFVIEVVDQERLVYSAETVADIPELPSFELSLSLEPAAPMVYFTPHYAHHAGTWLDSTVSFTLMLNDPPAFSRMEFYIVVKSSSEYVFYENVEEPAGLDSLFTWYYDVDGPWVVLQADPSDYGELFPIDGSIPIAELTVRIHDHWEGASVPIENSVFLESMVDTNGITQPDTLFYKDSGVIVIDRELGCTCYDGVGDILGEALVATSWDGLRFIGTSRSGGDEGLFYGRSWPWGSIGNIAYKADFHGSHLASIGRGIAHAGDDEYLICGYIFDTGGSYAVFLSRLESTGDIIWWDETWLLTKERAASGGGRREDHDGADVYALSNGSCYFLYTSQDSTIPAIGVIQKREASDPPDLWWQEYIGDGSHSYEASAIAVKEYINQYEHRYACTGRSDATATGDYDLMFYTAIDEGESSSGVTYSLHGGSGDDVGRDIVALDSGDFLCVGSSQAPSGGNCDLLLVRTTDVGGAVWSRTYHSSTIDEGYALLVADDGSYVMIGEADTMGPDGHDVLVVKTDPDGQLLSRDYYGGPGDQGARGAALLQDGDIVAIGYATDQQTGECHLYLLKIFADQR
ncbi:MAG: hypothetical protein JW819_08675 [Candidatus Krumholzibacteriota bacterium]|nr:hypothetical protein [Candidatus Krumholzibacteriota bacterium]